MYKIIGLIGKKGSGKTAIANYFINQKYSRQFLAQPIKEAAKILFNFSDDQVYGDLKEVVDPRYGFAPRKVLQIIGTEWCQMDLQERFREFETLVGRNHWVNLLCERILATFPINAKEPVKSYVIDDVRFPHEVKRLAEFSSDNIFQFVTIRINRDAVVIGDQHASEIESDSIRADYDVDNNGTIEQTYRNLDAIMVELR
jgi:GTPase SAR1 family protein